MHDGYLTSAFRRRRARLEADLRPATERTAGRDTGVDPTTADPTTADTATTDAAMLALRSAFDDLDARLNEQHVYGTPGEPEPAPDADAGHATRRQLVEAVEMIRAAAIGILSAMRAPAVPPPPPERPAPPRPRRIPIFGGRGDGRGEPRRDHRRDEPPPPPPRPVVHTASLLDSVQAAAEAADRLLAEAAPPPAERVTRPWAEDRDLVNLLRDLMTARQEQDPEYALRLLDRLHEDLALHHGIDVVAYDGGNGALFAFGRHTDPDRTDVVTVRPALVGADGRVLRPGEVRRPADEAARDARTPPAGEPRA